MYKYEETGNINDGGDRLIQIDETGKFVSVLGDVDENDLIQYKSKGYRIIYYKNGDVPLETCLRNIIMNHL